MALVKTSIFWPQNDSFLFEISKNDFSGIISVKKSDKNKFHFWTKSMA